MPTNVPLNEDGFEDPNAFMNSPTVTDNLTDSAKSRRTTMGAPSSVGTSRRLTVGRMSQLDDSDGDEFNIGPDAGLDEDDFDGESRIRLIWRVADLSRQFYILWTI